MAARPVFCRVDMDIQKKLLGESSKVKSPLREYQ
jgi:hypothetical protein